MNKKAALAVIIALCIGVGGGAFGTYSWLSRRQHADRTLHEDDHNGQGDHDGYVPHGPHEEHDEELVVKLSNKERNEYGIEVAAAGPGAVKTQISLPGEVILNEDRVAHIVPRAPGIVQEVVKSVGDTVRAGEVLAWLESAELGEAKVDYLTKWAELGCCTLDLARAQEVHDNTTRLLDLLKSSPGLDRLREMNGMPMGDNRSILISAYAEFVFAKAAYLREKPLLEKKIASEKDYQAAESRFKKADALYAATRDSVGFKVRRDLLEAKRAQQVRRIELKGVERQLYVLGLAAEDIKELEFFALRQATPAVREAVCNDPNCKDCTKPVPKGHRAADAQMHKTDDELAWYPLRAPFDGTVIDKHLVLGEKHGDDSSAFTVADLSLVWIDISVYQKDLPYAKKGQTVHISAKESNLSAEGKIGYVSSLVDEKTRTALARVVLPNSNGEWRPGLFVKAEIYARQQDSPVVIPKTAVQRMEGSLVVFIDTDEGFKPVPVSLGRSDADLVEIVCGLATGQRYVARGAFELKAKIVTSGLGAHAGHGH